MRKAPQLGDLTRRERQIIQIVYRLGKASAEEVMEALPDKPVNATVRTMLGVLEDKGFLRHEKHKGRFIYYPTIPLTKARKAALYNVLDTFYRGAEASAVMSILKESQGKFSDDEAASIIELIERSRKEGR
jgi:BlaI family penicillinase repressor